MLVGQPIAARLLAAVRAHRFTGGAADRPMRLTLSVGAAAAPEHGSDFDQLIRAARRAQADSGEDNAAFAHSREPAGLDLERFVGRTEPLARLRESLDDMVRGVARVVAVIGESGVGSSSLVRCSAPRSGCAADRSSARPVTSSGSPSRTRSGARCCAPCGGCPSRARGSGASCRRWILARAGVG